MFPVRVIRDQGSRKRPAQPMKPKSILAPRTAGRKDSWGSKLVAVEKATKPLTALVVSSSSVCFLSFSCFAATLLVDLKYASFDRMVELGPGKWRKVLLFYGISAETDSNT